MRLILQIAFDCLNWSSLSSPLGQNRILHARTLHRQGTEVHFLVLSILHSFFSPHFLHLFHLLFHHTTLLCTSLCRCLMSFIIFFHFISIPLHFLLHIPHFASLVSTSLYYICFILFQLIHPSYSTLLFLPSIESNVRISLLCHTSLRF